MLGLFNNGNEEGDYNERNSREQTEQEQPIFSMHRNFMEPLPVHPKMQEDRRGKGVARPVMDVAPFMTGEAEYGTAAAATAGR